MSYTVELSLQEKSVLEAMLDRSIESLELTVRDAAAADHSDPEFYEMVSAQLTMARRILEKLEAAQ
jgi:hypothetical protein